MNITNSLQKYLKYNYVMKIIFTIGYSAFEIDDFIKVLKANKITNLVDVRSKPFSEFYPNFNSQNLKKNLNSENISYENMVAEFGARQENKDFFAKEGYLDFEKFSQSEQFKSGIETLKNGLNLGGKIVLMCAEKDPISCHRSILIAKSLKNENIEVLHIMPDESLQSQNELEVRLLDIYFADRNQLNLFDKLNEKELIEKSYRLQNAKIGYRLEQM